MATPAKPLGSSRLILTLAVMISLGFGAAVLTPPSEQEGTASASPAPQTVSLDDTFGDSGSQDSNPDASVTTNSTTTAQLVDTPTDVQLPQVQLPANSRDTRDRADTAAPTPTEPRSTKPTPTAAPTTAAATLSDPALAAISARTTLVPTTRVPTTLEDGVDDPPLAGLSLPTTTTAQVEPEPTSPTTVVRPSGKPAIDPQRCTVSLVNNNTAEVAWSGATAPDGYEIRRNNVVIGSALTTATSFTDATLSKTATEYHFSVSAIGSGDRTWCGFVLIPTGTSDAPVNTSCRSWKDSDDASIWWIAVSNTDAGSSLFRDGTVIADVSDARPQITVSDRPTGRPTYEVRSGAETVSCL